MSMIGNNTREEPNSTPALIAADDAAGGRSRAANTLEQANINGAINASKNHFQFPGSPSMVLGATMTSTPKKPATSPSNPKRRNRSIRTSTLIANVNGGDSASTSVITEAGSFGAMKVRREIGNPITSAPMIKYPMI